jgi:hypothetical protein
VLFAQPSGASKLTSIFSSGASSLKRKVERPPILRSSGWSLETLDSAKIVQEKSIRVTNGDRKVLDLFTDGTMVFVASAANDFLAWGKRREFNINPLALIEAIYSFTALYAEVIKGFEEIPSEIVFGAQLHHVHLDGQKTVLGPGALNSIAQQFGTEVEETPEDSFQNSYVEKSATFDVEIAAYEIVRLIYLWFGLGEETIPYAYEKSGRKAVDSGLIATL